MAPYLTNALELLTFAVVLPVVGGIVGRALFFRRDDDDVALHPQHAAVADEVISHEPEPASVFEEPWPSFPLPPAVIPAEPAAVVREPEPRVGEPVRWGYRDAGLEVGKVSERVEALWRKFVSESKRRPDWARYNQWSGAAPYALAGAAGSAPGATTLTVEVQSSPNANPRELQEIWDAEILPELERQFGTGPFSVPDY